MNDVSSEPGFGPDAEPGTCFLALLGPLWCENVSVVHSSPWHRGWRLGYEPTVEAGGKTTGLPVSSGFSLVGGAGLHCWQVGGWGRKEGNSNCYVPSPMLAICTHSHMKCSQKLPFGS